MLARIQGGYAPTFFAVMSGSINTGAASDELRLPLYRIISRYINHFHASERATGGTFPMSKGSTGGVFIAMCGSSAKYSVVIRALKCGGAGIYDHNLFLGSGR